MARARKAASHPSLDELDPIDEDSGDIVIVVETPKGRRSKIAYDPERGVFMVKKVLPEGLVFPFDFGFIPSTKGGDGDPLDVLLLMDEPLTQGTVITARLVGVIEARQTERDGTVEKNDRLLAVATTSVLHQDVQTITDLPDSLIEQVERFFVSYNEQAGKRFDVLGRHGKQRAKNIFEAART